MHLLPQQVDFRADPTSGYTADVKYERQKENIILNNELGYGQPMESGNGGSIGQLPLAFDNLQNGYITNSIIPPRVDTGYGSTIRSYF